MVDKPLTVKQKKFVKAYVATDGNGQESAKVSYNVKTDNAARSIASENLTKPNVKFAIEQSLIKHHITMDAAIKPNALYLFRPKELVATSCLDDCRRSHQSRQLLA